MSDMSNGKAALQSSCKKIVDGETGKECFAFVTLTPGADTEESAFDIVLTDGAQAWTAQGVTTSVLRPANRSNRMRHVLEALTDLLPVSETYSYELDFETPGELELWAKWSSKHGKEVTLKVLVPLRAAGADSGRHVAAVLDSLLQNLQSARASNKALEQQCRDWRGAAEQSQKLVDEYVTNRQQQEREISQKVAALLNSKKQKLREMQKELDELRAGATAAAVAAGGTPGLGAAAGGDEALADEGDEEMEEAEAALQGKGTEDEGEEGRLGYYDYDQGSPPASP